MQSKYESPNSFRHNKKLGDSDYKTKGDKYVVKLIPNLSRKYISRVSPNLSILHEYELDMDHEKIQLYFSGKESDPYESASNRSYSTLNITGGKQLHYYYCHNYIITIIN